MLQALAEPFPPPVSLSSGYCTVLAGNEPKWGGLFSFSGGILSYVHERMDRIFISHFGFFWVFLRGCAGHTDTPVPWHTQRRTTRTSFADRNERVKWLCSIPASKDGIALQAPATYFSSSHCNISERCNGGSQKNKIWAKLKQTRCAPIASAALWGKPMKAKGKAISRDSLKKVLANSRRLFLIVA